MHDIVWPGMTRFWMIKLAKTKWHNLLNVFALILRNLKKEKKQALKENGKNQKPIFKSIGKFHIYITIFKNIQQ